MVYQMASNVNVYQAMKEGKASNADFECDKIVYAQKRLANRLERKKRKKKPAAPPVNVPIIFSIPNVLGIGTV